MGLVNDRMGEMRLWADAYTLNLDAMATAYSDPRFKREAAQNVKEARAAFNAIAEGSAGKEQARRALANQEAVIDHIARFDPGAFKAVMSTWKQVKTLLLSTSFDLREEITFTRRPDGNLAISQRGTGKPLIVDVAAVEVAVAFLNWVGDSQTRFDPLVFVKRVLERQGIKSFEDFEANKDKFAIDNPWAPTPRIIAP